MNYIGNVEFSISGTILVFHFVSRPSQLFDPSPAHNTIGRIAESIYCLYQMDGNCC